MIMLLSCELHRTLTINYKQMKKVTLILSAILFSVMAMAQQNSIDKVFKKYSGQEGVTVVNISPELFQIFSDLDVKEIEDVDFPMDKLTGLKVLSIENREILKGNDFYAEVTDDLDTNDYAEVISVQDGDEDVRMWMKTEGKQIHEFLLVVSSPDEGVLVYITGDFNLNDIEGLAESFGGLDGLDELDNIKIN